jgi:ankyrin repeat protein/tRNA A-37 threonylcarbamoyl transferase component Bud32
MPIYCPDCGLENRDAAKFCTNCGTNLITGVSKKNILENRYEILGVIKSGAMGAVYRALDQRLGVQVAVKKLFNNAAGPEEAKKAEEMFKREAAILASLHHSSLPKVFDYFSASDENGKDSNFLVMSLVDGVDLETWLSHKKLPLPLNEGLDVFNKILDILLYLHSQNPPVIYRDLKPSNVMVGNGSFFLVDFGIAKLLEGGKKTGTMMGTPGYASPDQCRGNDHLSNDIYSLGVLMHYLLTGLNPEDQSRPLFVFEPVRSINPVVPFYLEKLIASMVEIVSSNRIGSAEDVKKALNGGYRKPIGSAGATASMPSYAATKAGVVYRPVTMPSGKAVSKDEFFEASKKGDVATITQALSRGLDVNIKGHRGFTPLHYAAYKGKKAAAELLIDRGADLGAKKGDGEIPLHTAARYGHIDIVELLLRKGSDPDSVDNNGRTPLDTAEKYGKAEAAKLIRLAISQRANPMQPNTARVRAGAALQIPPQLQEKHLRAELSISQNPAAKPPAAGSRSLSSKMDADAFFEAIRQGDIAKINLGLVQGIDVNMQDKYGETPLHEASLKGFAEIVEMLVRKGANVNAIEKDGWTSLHLAAQEGKTVTAGLLIKSGADVNIKNNDGFTPLHLAIYFGQKNTAEVLIANGADIESRDCLGWTPLHVAAHKGQTNLCELLITKGSDIESRDNREWTPLHVASHRGQVILTEHLIKLGANINSKNNMGLTPLHLAVQEGRTATAEILLKGGADANAGKTFILGIGIGTGSTPLKIAIDKGKTDTAALLRKYGARE